MSLVAQVYPKLTTETFAAIGAKKSEGAEDFFIRSKEDLDRYKEKLVVMIEELGLETLIDVSCTQCINGPYRLEAKITNPLVKKDVHGLGQKAAFTVDFGPIPPSYNRQTNVQYGFLANNTRPNQIFFNQPLRSPLIASSLDDYFLDFVERVTPKVNEWFLGLTFGTS